MLVDTDVLIWHLRGLPKASQRLDQIPQLRISAITYLELLQGVRNQTEMLAIQQSFKRRNVEQLPVTPAITARAVDLMQRLVLSHRLQLGDALIAATAIEHGIPLLTGNARHFAPIADLRIEIFAVD